MSGERVLVAELSHETNTFASTPTDRSHFQERREYFGDEVLEKLANTNTAVGGAITVADAEGITLHPTVSAAAMPGGLVTNEAFERYTERILEELDNNEDSIDGVFLALHGAMVTEGSDDGEGTLLSTIRDSIGSEMPIVATLDLHGNISDTMVTEADALVAFESYPHVDMEETGRIGMNLLLRTMRNEISPTMHIERPPVLAYYPKQNTREGPLADVMAQARELENRDDVVKVNVFPGFHQADIPSMGFSIPVVTDDAPETAQAVARELAQTVWDKRSDFIGEYLEPAEAVAEAKRLAATLTDDDGPIVLADLGDNPGGGSAGDGTAILRELLDQEVENAGLAIMHDPEVVNRCLEAGVGKRLSVTLGGKKDDLHGEPIANVNGYVKAITDGEFINTGPMGTGTENHLGTAVRFECGKNDGVSVLVTENRMQPLDAEIWRHMTIQPERLDVLVVKSLNHYRADYEPMASHILPVDSPGLSAINPAKFEFTRIRHPQFPLDQMSTTAYPDWE